MDQGSSNTDAVLNDRRLRPGEELSGVFACTRKQLHRSANTGKPYLVVDLRDRRGVVAARGFRDPHRLAEQFQPGDLVEVSGTVRPFRDELQLHLASVRSVPGDATELLPHSYRDIEEIEGFLEQYARDVDDPDLRALLARILDDDDLRVAWRRAPCAPHRHHGYCGGALEHTISVCALAEALGEVHLRLDADLLMAAALLHELGRVEEFDYGFDFRPSRRGRLFGQGHLGASLIAERSEGALASERRDALIHCVLVAADALPEEPDYHAGLRQPLPEALALLRLCRLDAEVKAAVETMPGGPDLIRTRFEHEPGNGAARRAAEEG